jgi:hypothetical protein
MCLYYVWVDVSFFLLFFLSLSLFVKCGGVVSDSEYKQCGACSLCHLVLVLFLHGVLLVFFFIVRFSPCPFPLEMMVPS